MGLTIPGFCKILPAEAYLNTGRFGETIKESLNYLGQEVGLKVLDAWYERINFRIRNNWHADTYEMGIADELISFTREDYVSRAALFDNLISYQETAFLLSNLMWLIAHWDNLHDTEKHKLLTLIGSDRKDIRWIKAVSLNTSANPPPEIQQEILGNPIFFKSKTKVLVQDFPKELLLDCLQVYFGHPYAFGSIGVNNHNTRFWGKIARYVLYKKKEPFFSTCLRALLSDGVNGFSTNWPDGQQIWKRICRRPGKKTEMAKRLIYETASTNCSLYSAKKLWKTLINEFKREGKENELILLIVNDIEALQQTGRETDLIDFWGKEYLFEKVFPRIFPDQLIEDLLNIVTNDPSIEKLIQPTLKSLIEQSVSIRFYGTSLLIKRVSERSPVSDEFKNILSFFSNEFYDIAKEKLETMKNELGENVSPSNWINFSPSDSMR